MKGFLGRANSILNMSVVKKGKLFLGDVIRQDEIYMIGDDFGYNFIQTVAKRNWPKVIERGRIVSFRDQS